MDSDPKRVAQLLLGTLAADAPSPRAKENALAAFGVVSGVTSVATGAAGALSGAGTTGAVAAGQGVAAGAMTGAAGIGGQAVATAAGAKAAAATIGVVSIAKAVIIGVLAGGAAIYGGRQLLPSTSTSAVTESGRSLAPERTSARLPSVKGVAEPSFAAPQAAMDIPPPPPLDEAPSSPSESVPGSTGELVKATPRAQRPSDLRAGAVPVAASSEAIAPAAPELINPKKPEPDVSAKSLSNEIHRLDRARIALRTGAFARALQELAAYEAEFPNGTLAPEATVLHVEVLMQMGNEPGARALGSAFAAAHPTSGHVSTIQRLLASKRSP